MNAPEENVPKTLRIRDPVRRELFGGQYGGKAGGDKKKRKRLLLSRFASSLETSQDTSKQAAMLLLR